MGSINEFLVTNRPLASIAMPFHIKIPRLLSMMIPTSRQTDR